MANGMMRRQRQWQIGHSSVRAFVLLYYLSQLTQYSVEHDRQKQTD